MNIVIGRKNTKNKLHFKLFTGILTENYGWQYAFYIPALITAVLTIIWFVVVYDSPAQHPRINKDECEYIENALGSKVSKKKVYFYSFTSTIPMR